MTCAEKHAITLRLIERTPCYSTVRAVCLSCLADLRGKSEKETRDCRRGQLSGCGARYCSLQCLADHAPDHGDCSVIQELIVKLAGLAISAEEHVPDSFANAACRSYEHLRFQMRLMAAEFMPGENSALVATSVARYLKRNGHSLLADFFSARLRADHALRHRGALLRAPPLVAGAHIVACTDALEFHRIAYTDSDVDEKRAFILYRRAAAHIARNEYEQAIEDAWFSRQLSREIFGETSVAVAYCFEVIGTARSKQHRFSEAVDMFYAAAFIFARFMLPDRAAACETLRKTCATLVRMSMQT